MPANLTFSDLKTAVAAGEIDTVAVCMVDMQGRLMGKRFEANFFVNSGHSETHCCNYLLATDMEMITVPGYKSSSWQAGYGDYALRPDLSTLRRIPWMPGSAMVMCDVLDHHGHAIAHAPRNMLKAQVARAKAMGFDAMMATELEFYLFEEAANDLFDTGYRSLTPMAGTMSITRFSAPPMMNVSCGPCATVFTARASRLNAPKARPRPDRKR